MDCRIKYKVGTTEYEIIATNCPFYHDDEICQRMTEDFVSMTISNDINQRGVKGKAHSIRLESMDGQLIAIAENLSQIGNLRLYI